MSATMLQGLKVVELGQVLAAPYAGMILADLGADVVKVEKPDGGDEARNMGPAFRDDASMTFHDVNRGKRSVMIDLKSADGLARLFRLLDDADVLIHNLRPGDAQRLGLEADAVRARCPRLVYCEISAFGHAGPLRLQPGYEPLLQAFGGLVSINGHPSDAPSRMGASLVDQGTAMWLVIGLLSALLRRERTGVGGVVQGSLLETAIGWVAPRIHEQLNQGRPSRRYGTGHPNLVPYQTFEASDGHLMICAGNDRLFAKLAVALSHPEWLGDARFSTNRQRVQHRETLVAAIQHEIAGAGRRVWTDRLTAAGVPTAPVNSIAELVDEPQVRALDMLREVGAEGFVLAGLPLSFEGRRPAVERPAPRLGQDDARYP